MRLDENHKVDVSEFLRNMTANQEMDKRNLSGVDDPGSGQSSNPARVRIYLQCLLLRHEYDLRRGEVLNKADVVRTLTLAAQNARDKLLAIPDILMVAGMPSEYRKVVDDSVRKVLDEYAKELTEATLT
jgi:DNA helicase TIP49 (TBP-interacting protein)